MQEFKSFKMEQGDCNVQYLDHEQTNYFSSLINDYLKQDSKVQQFINFQPNDAGIELAIEARKRFPVNREILVAVLNEQYKHIDSCQKVEDNIKSLLNENTFTVCTAHQPNILTGYAYFIYKIMHAIVLAEHLNASYSQYNFVPIYYIGSEDDDLEELGTVKYNGKTFKWSTTQTGAVGSMSPQDLMPLVKSFTELLGPPSAKTNFIIETLHHAYQNFASIAAATSYIVNVLMGEFGIVIIDPNHKQLKGQFRNIIHNEITQPEAYKLVQHTNEQLNKYYKVQAYARPINFFYLHNQQRNRIELIKENQWKIVNTPFSWDQQTLNEIIEKHPEKFSPNVILRPLFQETILPNIAFIGGGSEIAYWMQLKSVFEHYGIFFPALILRQSIQFQSKSSKDLQEKLGYSLSQLFQSSDTLINQYIQQHHQADLNIASQYKTSIEQIKTQIIKQTEYLDKNLSKSIDAATTKMQYQVGVIEKKIKRAAIKKEAIMVNRIKTLKSNTFPNNALIERSETFIPEYLEYNLNYFHLLKQTILPYGNQFLFITPQFSKDEKN